MKVGDLVRVADSDRIGVVLEMRTSSMTIGGHTRNRTEVRVLDPERPFMAKFFSNTDFYEVISEAE